MKKHIFPVLSSLVLLLLAGAPAWGQADSDEARLENAAKAIEKDGSSKGHQERVQLLAKQFNVESSLVEDLRKKTGWGGATIQLAMAQHLAQSDPTTYPSLSDALTKIQTLREEKAGWGKIAKDLGFKLGPVVSAAQEARHELARDLRGERLQRTDRDGRPEKLDKPERPERPDRPQRPERPERAHVK